LSQRTVREYEEALVGIEEPHVIVKTMQCHENDPVILSGGCAALALLAYKNDTNIDNITDACGVAVVVAAMKRYPDHKLLQGCACFAVARIVSTNNAQKKFVEAGGVSSIVLSMKMYPNYAALQAYACLAIYFLSLGGEEISQMIVSADGLSALSEAAENHSNHLGVRSIAKKARDALATAPLPGARGRRFWRVTKKHRIEFGEKGFLVFL